MSSIPAIILVGGAGTRLPEVSATRPKPMADVRGRPFLEYVLAWLRASGVREVILMGALLVGVVVINRKRLVSTVGGE